MDSADVNGASAATAAVSASAATAAVSASAATAAVSGTIRWQIFDFLSVGNRNVAFLSSRYLSK